MLGAAVDPTLAGSATVIGALVTAFGVTMGTLWKAQKSRDEAVDRIAKERDGAVAERDYWRERFFATIGLPPDKAEQLKEKVKEVVDHANDDD